MRRDSRLIRNRARLPSVGRAAPCLALSKATAGSACLGYTGVRSVFPVLLWARTWRGQADIEHPLPYLADRGESMPIQAELDRPGIAHTECEALLGLPFQSLPRA